MAAVTVFQNACTQVDLADKHGSKHAVLIVGCYGFVHLRSYLCGCFSLLGYDAEQVNHHRHKQGCWYALSTDIADTETETFVAIAQ